MYQIGFLTNISMFLFSIKCFDTCGFDSRTLTGRRDKIGHSSVSLFFSIEEAAEAFMELVKDESKNGMILKLGKHQGKQFCTLALQTL